MTSREGFDAYCLYLAVNNHFNTDSYDYFKYAGKTSVKLETFLKRKDKYHFAKLARKYHVELLDFISASLGVDVVSTKFPKSSFVNQSRSPELFLNCSNPYEKAGIGFTFLIK